MHNYVKLSELNFSIKRKTDRIDLKECNVMITGEKILNKY